MPLPRHLLVDNTSPGFYHVMSRCVRKAWLCGQDPDSGQNFEHRREWIRQRILFLSRIFAIDTYAYAVMTNHYHIVVYLDPDRVTGWSDEDIARRWLLLCPPRWIKSVSLDALAEHPVFRSHVAALVAQPDKIAQYRERLRNLSWFMRFLNETVARRANAEDGVTGRFWESRFRSQALLDEAAVLTCMAYVDLNPIRSGLADRPETSAFTSIKLRLANKAGSSANVDSQDFSRLRPMAESSGATTIPLPNLREADYLELVDWVGRAPSSRHTGAIPAHLRPVLERLGIKTTPWPENIHQFGRRYKLAAGHWEALKARARAIGRRWLQGQSTARAMYA